MLLLDDKDRHMKNIAEISLKCVIIILLCLCCCVCIWAGIAGLSLSYLVVCEPE